MLEAFSEANPPASGSQPLDTPVWSLDELFLLPKARIKYYKKLYGRLLKGTQPGRSDYKLLIGAAEKLDKLLATVEARMSITPGLPAVTSPVSVADEIVVDFRKPFENVGSQSPSAVDWGGAPPSEASSARNSNLSSAYVQVLSLFNSPILHFAQASFIRRDYLDIDQPRFRYYIYTHL